MSSKKKIGILLFDDVELLDFAGPLEVFSAADYVLDNQGYDVQTVAVTEQVRINKCDMIVTPTEPLDTENGYDLFLMPGGFGTRSIVKDESLLKKLNATIEKSKRVATVCTGSLILAKLGYLKNSQATSHHLALDLLKKLEPSCTILNQRFIDNGRFIVSAGVSAGIDMAFYIVEQDLGKEVSEKVAKYIEWEG